MKLDDFITPLTKEYLDSKYTRDYVRCKIDHMYGFWLIPDIIYVQYDFKSTVLQILKLDIPIKYQQIFLMPVKWQEEFEFLINKITK